MPEKEQVASNEHDKPNTSADLPRWLTDISRLLPIRSQFVLSGNIRDVFLVPSATGLMLTPIVSALWSVLHARGFEFLTVYDRTDGLDLYPDSPEIMELSKTLLSETFQDYGAKSISRQRFVEIARIVATTKGHRIACVAEYASRLAPNGEHLSDPDYEFFVACEKIANQAVPVLIPGQPGVPLFNPLFWLVNRPNDLPSWLSLDNERIGTIAIPLPDYGARFNAAGVLGSQYIGYNEAHEAARQRFAEDFATLTDGMTLQGMLSVSQLAREHSIKCINVDDAVRSYKVGIQDSPWKKSHLKEKVRNATGEVAKRVKGQERAITATVNILVRSIMGMTGAHAPSNSSRPRGVMFFAGPTGVGKTELAKALTHILFGDDQAYIRFDMSEFAQEHSDARLLGAPPGYVGYDAGGELTRAVREKPFSVILFDEIEKAHPRILDKFLQILEDGRLTDGRGETVYFSEAVIIFTSNLGIYIDDGSGQRVLNVNPGDNYEDVDKRIRDAISHHFKFALNRPEILNRIGDNIVVFNFITAESAVAIFNGMLGNVRAKVREELGITLSIPDNIRLQLQELCISDLSNGGRGIGNKLESLFVNPLSRALFNHRIESDKTLQVLMLNNTPLGTTLDLG